MPKLYNPLDRHNLAKSIEGEILTQPVLPMSQSKDIVGAGVYVIYYRGTFLPYGALSGANENSWEKPIYVGKAIPEGSRKGGYAEGRGEKGKALAKRLSDHKRKISSAANIETTEFWVRVLPLEDIWIPLGESIVIDTFRPLWNVAIDGFGNNRRGAGRLGQKYSAWEVLHPPTGQRETLTGGQATVDAVLGVVEDHFAGRSLRKLPKNVAPPEPEEMVDEE